MIYELCAQIINRLECSYFWDIFGVFYDYKRITCGKLTKRLGWIRNSTQCLMVAEPFYSQTNDKVGIESIKLMVTHFFPNNVLKLELLNAIQNYASIIIILQKVGIAKTLDIWSVQREYMICNYRFTLIRMLYMVFLLLRVSFSFLLHIRAQNISLLIWVWSHQLSAMIIPFYLGAHL